MNRVFADANFWIARFNPKDPWHTSALAAQKQIGNARIVTNEVVLTEFLDHYSKQPKLVREQVAALVRQIRADHKINVLPQTPESFERGFALFGSRLDKEWGMSDCISMSDMTSQGLTQVLTWDDHFRQAQFEILMQPVQSN
ncbi:MAG: type II toxin-antitoxin system VapC family toxin [Phycisphaerales bacterium]|nr:type II toxin-antitoxin system VapC family toxin [Phycisphaerales bacterium]